MTNLGFIPTNGTVYLPFSTNDSLGAAVTFTGTISNFKIYKNGSVTERTSTSGITLTKDFDGATGSHLIIIDLSDNTDTGFWANSSTYTIAANGITVDSKTVTSWIGEFKIGIQSSNLAQLLATPLTESSAGYLAASLIKLLDIAAPVLTVASVNQSGDSFTKVDLNLDAKVSTRSSHTAADIWSVVTRTLTAFGFTVDSNPVTISGTKQTLDDLNDISQANVLTQVNGALDSPGSELSAIPNGAATVRQKLSAIYQYFFHKRATTATTESLYKANDSTVLGTATVSDDGTTATHTKIS